MCLLNLSQNQSAEIFKLYIWPYMIIKKHNNKGPNQDGVQIEIKIHWSENMELQLKMKLI